MTAHWIGYVAFVLVLLVIKEVIEDGARDRSLAYLLCAVLGFALIVCLAVRGCA